jgi:homoserine O-acetyltransferase
MAEKFGRSCAAAKQGLRFSTQDVEFQIESYLRYQGDKFSLLRRQHLPADHRALDYFDPARATAATCAGALARATAKLPAGELHHRLALLARALARDRQGAARQPRDVSYAEIDAPHGHDAFLLDDPRYHGVCAPTSTASQRSWHDQKATMEAHGAAWCPQARACSTWAAATASC